MTRPVVYRMLPKPWTSMQEAERALYRVEWGLIQAGWANADCTCDDCRSSAADRHRAAAVVRDCAAAVHALWLPREQAAPEEDVPLLEALVEFALEDHETLPEEGVRLMGTEFGLYARFADSASPEEPELSWLEPLSQ